MGVSANRADLQSIVNFQELSLDLARLDLARSEELGDQILRVLSYHLRTDRASLLLLDEAQRVITGGACLGFQVAGDDWKESSIVIRELCKTRSPLLIYNIRDHPQWLSPWPQTYKTDACAVYPLEMDHAIRGVLCLSNLSAQQLSILENNAAEMSLVLSQVVQLSQLLLASANRQASAPLSLDELSLIGTLVEKLDRGMDARNVFTIFTEVVARYLPFDLLVVIHDRMREPQQGIVCTQRPCPEQDVRRVFTSLMHQWQRRHKRAPSLDIADAALLGTHPLNLGSDDCPAGEPLGRLETFPVFIDNDLFGLVAVAADERHLDDQRLMRLFGLLSHQLLLHVKKGLLLEQSQEMQTVDALTGLYSERHFYQMMEREFDRAARYSVPLCLMIMDVDHFKDVNEAYGFETGDMLLQEIRHIIMENIRSTDFVSRYSGERFILVLPETHAKNSEIMANRLRRYIENNSFFIPNTNVYIKVTVSLGVASYLDHKPASLAQFIEYADTALYIAKRNGRNQVVGYSYVITMMLRDPGHES